MQFGYGIPDFQLALTNGLSIASNSNPKFLLFPNPIKNTVSFVFPNDFENAKLSIYTTLGQKIKESEISIATSSISLEELNSGVYIYKIENATFSQSGKIIKN